MCFYKYFYGYIHDYKIASQKKKKRKKDQDKIN